VKEKEKEKEVLLGVAFTDGGEDGAQVNHPVDALLHHNLMRE